MARYFQFDAVLDEQVLAATHAAVRAGARFEMLVNKPEVGGFAAGLVSRHDAAGEFLRTGGLSGRPVDLLNLADRVNFFRSTFAYGAGVELPGIEAFLGCERFAAAARELYERPIIEPTIVFGNAALPEQEIGLHTDVPEFRGFDRDRAPEWLLVVMHHSGLFEAERVPIATGVVWLGEARGGAFWFWPRGPGGVARAVEIADNQAILLDTDSVFHAVAPVEWSEPERRSERPPVEVGATLAWDRSRERWVVRFRGAELTTLAAADVRLSISWKARCYRSEDERARVRASVESLELAAVLERLRRDLADRGRLPSAEAELPDAQLAIMLIDEYINFPSVPR